MLKIEIENLPAGTSREELVRVAESTCKSLGLSLDYSILEIIFLSNKEISKLNKQYMSKDGPTDVLSFPQSKYDHPHQLFGTIVVSPEEAEARGENIFELVKHGILHLTGLDHEKGLDEWAKNAEIINHRMGV